MAFRAQIFFFFFLGGGGVGMTGGSDRGLVQGPQEADLGLYDGFLEKGSLNGGVIRALSYRGPTRKNVMSVV